MVIQLDDPPSLPVHAQVTLDARSDGEPEQAGRQVVSGRRARAFGTNVPVVVDWRDNCVAAVQLHCERCSASLVLDVHALHRACGPGIVLHVTLHSVTHTEAQPAEGAYEPVVVSRRNHRVATVEVDCERRGAALVFDVQLGHRAWHPRVVLHVAFDSVAHIEAQPGARSHQLQQQQQREGLAAHDCHGSASGPHAATARRQGW
mmetsp:Transcript_30624/g.72212  ORF Transcript_30624/g.72212 Transcript_30624/m.72212 type:complete len:204 (-) Transcript_30624:32-643(-)